MRAKSIILLVLALGCGLIAAIGVTQVISQDDSGPAQPVGETVNILVAKEDILEGSKLTPEMVKIEAWPKSKVPKGTLVDVKQIAETRARTDILLDEPIREQKLFGKDDIKTAAIHIDNNMRAVPIKIEKDSYAGLIQPGDRVDVLANLRKNKQQGIMSSRTVTLLQNIEVFAVDDVYKIDPDSAEGKTITAKTVSLLLTPEQAVKVDLALTLGKLRLTMRSPNDASLAQGDTEISVDDILNPSEASNTPKPETNANQNMVQSPITVPSHGTWKMRIITGPGVNDLVLEEQDGNNGEKVWRVIQEGEELPGNVPANGMTPGVTPMPPMSPLGPIDNGLVPPNLEPDSIE
ncbi:MAG: Flp pilus assembly protein CpaB [Planctomycetia bacterium]|jgi:pilus assembly protein CpaB